MSSSGDRDHATSYFKAAKVYGAPAPSKKGSKHKAASGGARQSKVASSGASNNELELYYEIQRRENEAARVIQDVWKRSRRLVPWRAAVRAMFAVVKIQKVIRGWVVRRYVARWFAIRNVIATQWQSCVRKYQSNKRLRPKLKLERRMAIRIQCMVRRFIARRKVDRVLRNLAATRIQALWRGVVDRSLADRMWLDKVVIPIQNAARRMNAMRKLGGQKKMLGQAALLIQRKFRSSMASSKVAFILNERELAYRSRLIQVLTAEEEFYQQKLSRLMNRVVKNDIKDKTQQALRAIQDHEELIVNKENELSEVKRQAEILSPRAIELGFREELAKNSLSLRKELSDLKYDLLFRLTAELHQCEHTLQTNVHEVEELAANRARVAKYREQEYEDRRHLNYYREQTKNKKDTRTAIAEERRKWQVKFYTKSGKPDKRRRPGKPWDPSVYAGPEKSTYSGGAGVDLLAFVREQSTGANKTAQVQANVDQAVKKVSLQTYLDQVNTYQQLLNPISLIMQQYMGLLPKAPAGDATQDAGMTGFGDVGQEFKEAMHSLDVQPPPRTRIKTRGRKEYKTFAFSPSRETTASASKDLSLMRIDVPSTASSVPMTAERSKAPSRTTTGTMRGRSVFSSSGHENLEDVDYPISETGDGAASEKLMLGQAWDKESVQSTTPPHSPGTTLSSPPRTEQDEDFATVRPMLEDLLMPSSRYWKRPPKKYLPAEDAFSMPKRRAHREEMTTRPAPSSTLSPLVMRTSPREAGKAIQGSSLALVRSERERGQLARKPSGSGRGVMSSSTSLSNLSAGGGEEAEGQDAYMDMAAIVAKKQEREKNEREQLRALNREMRHQAAEKRKEKKAAKRRVGAIPWELLDEIDGMRTRQEAEISHVEFHHPI